MSDAGNWCLIESDPGVFTELIRGFGVQGVQVEELWSLEPENLKILQPVHGLIFLFKLREDTEPAGSIVQDSRLETIFFAKQVVNNACATQAILSILLNNSDPEVKLGSVLTEFKDFCQSFDPTMKGYALSNSQPIRTVHNSFARYQRYSSEEIRFNLLAVVCDKKMKYEKELAAATQALKVKYMALAWSLFSAELNASSNLFILGFFSIFYCRYSSEEIRFNLLAVVCDKKMKYEKELAAATQALKDPSLDAATKTAKQNEVVQLKILIEEEAAKLESYRIENIRRKHNYLPLIMNLLKLLAKQGQLVNLYQKAVELNSSKKEKVKP
ncbi:ubiquitin carboxyl-terminal hydrolase isozyme L5 [Diaphorina citri]|uniref:Ubiquitin carboxyl-terminal hydrolase n=1 Tax=Diaphorina citri TaxID=121845 RepID=A0A1S4EHX5_DIACI|nr:ubiquitin carboxyl-terminal hydrolase isozyme L5 [Diaphorina citri]